MPKQFCFMYYHAMLIIFTQGSVRWKNEATGAIKLPKSVQFQKKTARTGTLWIRFFAITFSNRRILDTDIILGDELSCLKTLACIAFTAADVAAAADAYGYTFQATPKK